MNSEISLTATNSSGLLNRITQSSFLLIIAALVFLLAELSYGDIIKRYYPHSLNTGNLQTMLAYDLFTFICFFSTSTLYCRWVWKENLSNIGLNFPKSKLIAILSILFALSILLPEIIYFAHLPEFQKTHTMPTMSKFMFALIQFFCLPFYYFSEEFFFRGFLFLGLWKRVRWHSFWITDIIFTASHVTKPVLEILMCIPASVVFNIITLWTRSIVPAFIVHSTLGITLNYLV